MKRIIWVLLISLIVFTACNDDSSILEPSSEVANTQR